MQRRNMAQRRYLLRFMPLMVCYALILIGVSAAQRHGTIAGATLAVMSVLPAIPLIGVIIVMRCICARSATNSSATGW